jgi:hypothetical protein
MSDLEELQDSYRNKVEQMRKDYDHLLSPMAKHWIAEFMDHNEWGLAEDIIVSEVAYAMSAIS